MNLLLLPKAIALGLFFVLVEEAMLLGAPVNVSGVHVLADRVIRLSANSDSAVIQHRSEEVDMYCRADGLDISFLHSYSVLLLNIFVTLHDHDTLVVLAYTLSGQVVTRSVSGDLGIAGEDVLNSGGGTIAEHHVNLGG